MYTEHEMGLVIGCQLLQIILQHIAERKFQQLPAMKIKHPFFLATLPEAFYMN
jgi:hypothetical protein